MAVRVSWLCFAIALYADASDLSLQLLVSAPKTHSARCLDGSAPGYYIARNASSHGYVIHFEGGGWSWTAQESLERSKTDLGSSRNWGNTTTCYGACDGILSSNSTANPDFYSWNRVFVGYCDGGSFTGTKTQPTNVSNTPLWFSGRYILDAVLDDLLERQGLRNATHVLLTGGSAGGLSTYIHADYVGSKLPPTTHYKAMGDAGFFLDHPTFAGTNDIQQEFQTMVALMDSVPALNPACVQAYPASEQWRCVFAQYTIPHTTTPLFVAEGRYDSWHVHNILKLGCGTTGKPINSQDCSAAQLKAFYAYGDAMLANITAAIAASDGHGAFVSSCIVHCQTIFNEGQCRWDAWHIDRQSVQQTVGDWFFSRTTGDSSLIQQCDYPCNQDCPVFT